MNSKIYMVLVVILIGAGAYWFGSHHATNGVMNQSDHKDRKVLYWYDPMAPDQHFDKPGKSPFMDMQLMPRYADTPQTAANGGAALKQTLGIRVATVEQGIMDASLEAAGIIAFNQREVSMVQARTNGFVSHAYAHAAGDVVKQGEALADIVTPEWASAQAEYLLLLKNADHGLIDAARSRLQLLGMPADLIAHIEGTHEVSTTVTIRAPRDGMIESFDMRDGVTVNVGAPLTTIYGLHTLWLEVALPESQGALAFGGQSLSAHVTAYPQITFKGKVAAILPDTNVESHTLRVRVELQNTSGKLRPGMFAHVVFDRPSTKPVLTVPSESLIRSGARNIVLVMTEDDGYQPVEVQTGMESNGRTEVISGVTAGQRVVASGQFLIDSEANLNGALNRMRPNDVSEPARQGDAP